MFCFYRHYSFEFVFIKWKIIFVTRYTYIFLMNSFVDIIKYFFAAGLGVTAGYMLLMFGLSLFAVVVAGGGYVILRKSTPKHMREKTPRCWRMWMVCSMSGRCWWWLGWHRSWCTFSRGWCRRVDRWCDSSLVNERGNTIYIWHHSLFLFSVVVQQWNNTRCWKNDGFEYS